MASLDPLPPAPRSGKPPLPWRARRLEGAVSTLHSASLRGDGTINRCGVSSPDHPRPRRRQRVILRPPPRPPVSSNGSNQLPVVVYFHGGGFVFHSAASVQYDALCRRLASAVPAVVASVDYWLAPEHRFPAPYDDGEAALRWALGGAGGALPSPPPPSSVDVSPG